MKSLKKVVLILFALCLLIPAPAVIASPAKDQLKATIDKILQTLKDPAFKSEGNTEKRRQVLRDIVYERFDFLEMTKACLGTHMEGRTEKELSDLSELFGRLLEETYVSNIEGYTDEKVVYTKDRFIKKKNITLVYTEVVSDSIKTPINYKMHQVADGSWKIIDMKIEGVLIVRNYRDQFDQILRKKPFDKLLEELREQLNS